MEPMKNLQSDAAKAQAPTLSSCNLIISFPAVMLEGGAA